MDFGFHLGKKLQLDSANGSWSDRCPNQLDRVLEPVRYSYGILDSVVQDLKNQNPRWSEKDFEYRHQRVVSWLQGVLLQESVWKSAIALETGRAPLDMAQEWEQLRKWIEQFKKNRESLQKWTGHPRGLVAVLGSSVWPLYHATTDLALALLGGNGVILKPSERVTRALDEALFLSLVQHHEIQSQISLLPGDREVGRRLATHAGMDLVLFRGSFETGMRIKQETLGQVQKEILLGMGSKNNAWVDHGSSPAWVKQLIHDCFFASGQHCRSISNIWVARSQFESFLDGFHELAKTFKIGGTEDEVFAGALMDAASLDRYLKFAGIAEREGAEILMRGKTLERLPRGLYATPTLAVFRELSPAQYKRSVALQTEILAPHVNLIAWDSAVPPDEWVENDVHGHLVAYWGESPRTRQLFQRHYGQVFQQCSVMDWDPWASYQVRKKSGNHAFCGPALLSQLTVHCGAVVERA